MEIVTLAPLPRDEEVADEAALYPTIVYPLLVTVGEVILQLVAEPVVLQLHTLLFPDAVHPLGVDNVAPFELNVTVLVIAVGVNEYVLDTVL